MGMAADGGAAGSHAQKVVSCSQCFLPEYQERTTLPTSAMYTRAFSRHTYARRSAMRPRTNSTRRRTVSATSALRNSTWRSPFFTREI